MLSTSLKQFTYYKQLSDKSIAQLTDEQLSFQINGENSICHIMQHLAGNMHSRWTDIFTTDGEKPWRNRDKEFENCVGTITELKINYQKGWQVLFETLSALQLDDLNKTIYVRNDGLSVQDAILRQLCHYSYHVGQIVFRTKQLIGEENWQSLSIPKMQSNRYNTDKFNQPKGVKDYLDDLLDK
jgi:Protein of unknown function (DUF1572)